jgi:hypothetical protein
MFFCISKRRIEDTLKKYTESINFRLTAAYALFCLLMLALIGQLCRVV